MKTKTMYLMGALLVIVVCVAQAARRGRATITNPVTVNPLAGYADQIDSGNNVEPGMEMELSGESSSLLDAPGK